MIIEVNKEEMKHITEALKQAPSNITMRTSLAGVFMMATIGKFAPREQIEQLLEQKMQEAEKVADKLKSELAPLLARLNEAANRPDEFSVDGVQNPD